MLYAMLAARPIAAHHHTQRCEHKASHQDDSDVLEFYDTDGSDLLRVISNTRFGQATPKLRHDHQPNLRVTAHVVAWSSVARDVGGERRRTQLVA